MKDLFQNFPLKHLNPQECFVTKTPTLISTILGSCLGITVFEQEQAIGGMAHAFLPVHSEYRETSFLVCRFVDTAIPHLINQVLKRGGDPSRIEVKIFGGAAVMKFDNQTDADANMKMRLGVGQRNIETAREILNNEGFKIVSSDVGGATGRKLLFLTHTGGAWIKRLGSSY